MTKRIENLVEKYKWQYGNRLTDKQCEKLARATLTGRVWGIRRGLKLYRVD